MKVKILSKTENALETICTFAKNCYSDEGIISLGDKYLSGNYNSLDMIKFVKALIKTKHYTPIETVQINFVIEGVSRALMAQQTRHRIATFCVKSQRYVNESGFYYITPPTIKESGFEAEYQKYMVNTAKFYEEMVNGDIPPEDARYILPNACETSIGASFNLRSLMHFMELRLCSHAQWEIRELAGLMRTEVINRYPWMSEFLQQQCILNGKCSEKKHCRILEKA